MFFKVPTQLPHIFIIKDGNKMIGRLSTKGKGLFYFFTEEPYHELNAFGVNKELLESSEILFEGILVFCKNKKYLTSKERLLKEGIKKKFKFGTKVFLPINKWAIVKSDDQLSFNFQKSL